MDAIVVQMRLERITKNTVRYAAPEGSPIETIYIPKESLGGEMPSAEMYPQDIELTITEA